MNTPLLTLCALALPFVIGCGSDDDGPKNDPVIEAALRADCQRAGGAVIDAALTDLIACARELEGPCVLRRESTAVGCALPEREGMCGDTISAQELLLMLNGAVLTVGAQIEEGVSVYELFAGVLVGMLYNGIDWNQLDDLHFEFDGATGSYLLESGASRVGFRLYWARDFEDHQAGDPITDNVFAVASYVRGIQVSVGGSVPRPRIEYDYDEGPLFGLIEGGISIEGRDPRDLHISLRLRADAIAVELDSVGRRRFELPVPWSGGLVSARFDYETHALSTRLPVPELKEAIENDGFALDLAETVFEREYLVLDAPIYTTWDRFEATDFVIRTDEDGAFFEGEYTGQHAVEAQVLGQTFSGALHHEGLLSNRQQNWTTFYCDPGRTDLWGTARHDLDLEGGRFTFSSGRSFRYGAGELEWEEDQVED